jgi:putative addiction module killer protein
MMEILVKEYELSNGIRPFGKWYANLDIHAALKVRTAIARIECGNFSNAQSVGHGVSEFRINTGPGYRIYFGRDGDVLIILLGGGTKSRQSRDIMAARQMWQEYKHRKNQDPE